MDTRFERGHHRARPAGVVALAVVALFAFAGCGGTPAGTPPSQRTVSRESPSPTATPGSRPASTTTGSPAAPTSATTGLTGVEGTTVTSRCPVVTDPPCPTVPVATRIDVADPAGTVVDSVQSGSDGYFRVLIAAGTYTLRVTAPRGLSVRPTTTEVTVRAGQILRVQIQVDSGIR